MGRLPTARLPQDRAGEHGRARGHGWLLHARRRNHDRLGRYQRRSPIGSTATSTRCRRDRAYPDLDLCRQPGSAADPRALASRRPWRRGWLSDALHERLTERFVDRRTSVLMRRLRENAMLEPQFNKPAKSWSRVTSWPARTGFVFVPDASSGGSEAWALQNAAQKALASEIAPRATRACARRRTSNSCWRATVRCADGRGGRQATARAEPLRRACGSSPTSTSRRAARGRGGAARPLGQIATSKSCSAMSVLGRGAITGSRARRFPIGRGARRARSPARSGGSKGTGAAGAGHVARQIGVVLGAYHIYLPALASGAGSPRLWALSPCPGVRPRG